jgi:hypothetical protein
MSLKGTWAAWFPLKACKSGGVENCAKDAALSASGLANQLLFKAVECVFMGNKASMQSKSM